MPITQDRMLDLIAAAEDYKQSCQSFVDAIVEINRLREAGYPYKDNLAALLSIRTADFFLRNAHKTIETIVSEREHFRARKGQNIRHANYLRRKRAEQVQGQLSPDQQLELEKMTLTGRYAPGTPGHASLLEQIAKGQSDEQLTKTVPVSPSHRPSTLPHYDRFADGDPEDQVGLRPTYTGDHFVDEKDPQL